MSTKVSALALLPKSVIDDKKSKAVETNDREEIREMLVSRTIVASDRFILKPGKYEFADVSAASWTAPNGKKAVMAVLTFKDGSMTTLGSLRKIDASLKNYGPEGLPLNEAELLDEIMARSLEITEVVDTKATVFKDNDRIVDSNDETGYKTKPTKIMRWDFATAKAAPAKAGKKA